MTDSEKLQLIARVLNRAHDELETWRDDHIGATLAYLSHAISGGYQTDWSDENGDEFTARARDLFRAWFTPDDPVWQFIIT